MGAYRPGRDSGRSIMKSRNSDDEIIGQRDELSVGDISAINVCIHYHQEMSERYYIFGGQYVNFLTQALRFCST